MADKNEGPRLLVTFERATGGDRSQAIASEISLGGLFIETKTPMAVGTLLTVEISSGHTDMVTLEGRVFSTRAKDEGPKAPAGMAVRFLDLPMAAVAKLTAMLERHRPPARTQIGTGAPPPPTPEDGILALNVQIPQAGVPNLQGTAIGLGLPGAQGAPAAAPAPKPNLKGTAIMADAPGRAEALAQVAAAQAAAAAAAEPAPAPQPNMKGTAIMADPVGQAQAMAQVAAAREALAQGAAAPPPPEAAPAPPPDLAAPPPQQQVVPAQKGTAFMVEAPPLPDPAFAPTPAAPPAFAPAPAPSAPAFQPAPGPSPAIAPPPTWNPAAPVAVAPKSNTALIVVIIFVLLFILGGGLSVLFWALN